MCLPFRLRRDGPPVRGRCGAAALPPALPEFPQRSDWKGLPVPTGPFSSQPASQMLVFYLLEAF